MLPDTIDIDNFSGTGSQVDYVLTSTPSTENAIDVYINGLYQQKDTFSLSGNTLTFSAAPPSGATIEVKHQFVASVKGEVVLTAGTGISITKNSANNFTISNTLVDTTVSYNTPTGQSLTYTTPSSSAGQAGSVYGPQTFTVTDGVNILSGTASISGLPNGLTVDSQSYNNSDPGNVLTITLGGVFPSANSLNTNLTISGLNSAIPPLTVDYLVVAGGGAGGYDGGGGGAGGLRTSYGSTSGGGASAESSLSLSTATNYAVTVGAGGVGVQNTQPSNAGNNSLFHTITSIGGGYGGSALSSGQASGSGGSGGGGSRGPSNTGGSAGTSNQGYAGGNGTYTAPAYGTAGGGGAASVGGNGAGSGAGNGGNGLEVNIIGGTGNYYAGGGGGGVFNAATTYGSGGSGGGGNGGNVNGSQTSGTANTGGGGGGSGNAPTSGSGGSGVVIIRYPSLYTIAIGAGLIETTATDGAFKVITFTAGTGNISFS
jgi:hypothetical protein